MKMIKNKALSKIVLLVLFVSFFQPAIVPLVSAEEPTPRLPKMGPYIGWQDTNPFIGGFQETEAGWGQDYITTKKVRITVSFPDTSSSAIPADNYIAGGMFLQGQGGQDYTDYGYVATLSIDSEGTLQYNMAFYETYEWLWQDYWICWQKAIVLDGVDPSEPVTLTMRWSGGFVEWLYTTDGITHLAGLYNVYGYRSNIILAFFIGEFNEISLPSAWWGAYYQFGIYSETEILNGGWTVRLERPQYYTNDGRWKYVQKATSLNGEMNFMDHWWRWGGEKYYGANARYYGDGGDPGTLYGFAVEFFYGPNNLSLLPWRTLWDSPPEDPEDPSQPSGYTVAYRGYLYSYSTVTLDPNDDDVSYWFFWGDDTDSWTGSYLSGVTATAYHSWSSTGDYWIYVLARDSTGRYSWWSPGLKVHVREYTGGGGGSGKKK